MSPVTTPPVTYPCQWLATTITNLIISDITHTSAALGIYSKSLNYLLFYLVADTLLHMHRSPRPVVLPSDSDYEGRTRRRDIRVNYLLVVCPDRVRAS